MTEGRRDLLIGAAALCLGLCLRLVHPGSDPPTTLWAGTSEIVDGPWYLAEALDRARGHDVDVFTSYRKPVFTALMRVAFRGAGDAGLGALERAHAAEAIVGALGIALAGGAAWAASGRRAGVVAAVLFAASFPLVGYARTTLVYAPLASVLAGALWLYARGVRTGSLPFIAAAWAALGAAAVGLQVHAIALAPGFALGQVLAAERRGRALAIGAGLAGVGVALLFVLEPSIARNTVAKASFYLGDTGPLDLLKRVLRAPFASGFFAKAPLVLGLAWLGTFVAIAGTGEPAGARRRENAIEVALAAGVVVWIALCGAFKYEYYGIEAGAPTRHLVCALVPAAILAGLTVERLAWTGAPAGELRACESISRGASLGLPTDGCVVGGPATFSSCRTPSSLPSAAIPSRCAREPIDSQALTLDRLRRPAPLAFAWAALGAYAALGTGFSLGLPALYPPDGAAAPAFVRAAASFRWLAPLALALGAGALALARLAPAGARLRLPPAAVAALLAAGIALDLARLAPGLVRPQFTLRDANARAADVLPPGARVYGPWAHALTYAAPDVTRHLPPDSEPAFTERAATMTHLAIDASWGPLMESKFAAVGRPLERVLEVEVRGWPVIVYRFGGAR